MPALQPQPARSRSAARHHTTGLFDHRAAGGDRTAGGQQIVDDQHLAARPDDGIGVDLQGVGAIFEVVGMRKRLARQLSRLANGISPAFSSRASGAAKDKAPGLGRGDQFDPLPSKWFGKLPDRLPKRGRATGAAG